MGTVLCRGSSALYQEYGNPQGDLRLQRGRSHRLLRDRALDRDRLRAGDLDLRDGLRLHAEVLVLHLHADMGLPHARGHDQEACAPRRSERYRGRRRIVEM